MARPKIFLLTHEFPPKRGGAGIYCEEMGRSVEALGHEVETWAPAYGQDEPENKKTRFLPLRGTQDWRCSLRLVRETRRHASEIKGQVLHLAEPGALRAFVRLGLGPLKPARLLVTLHGSEIPKFSRFPLERFRFRRLLRRADHIHVLSRYNHDALLRIFPELKKSLLLVPGAPSRSALPVEKKNPSQDGIIRILTIGRIHPRKGQNRMLTALTSLPNELKSRLEYHIVGPKTKPAYHRELRGQAAQTRLPVHFLGDLSPTELRNAYAAVDLFALTSIPATNSVEGFGFVYLEAAAHGLPALAHRIGGVEDTVVHEQTGLLVPHDKPGELAQALERLITDSALRRRLGEAARERAAGFTWERPAKALYGEA